MPQAAEALKLKLSAEAAANEHVDRLNELEAALKTQCCARVRWPYSYGLYSYGRVRWAIGSIGGGTIQCHPV